GICISPDGRVFFSTNDEQEDKVIEVKASVAKAKSSLNETSESKASMVNNTAALLKDGEAILPEVNAQ
ncbi:MAG TPA: hypothetical protein VFH43_07950, partial [Candidatus Kapabacteria bacterium]|nr:hypothetical protein [Candidatus Kapabacteria bacterium]